MEETHRNKHFSSQNNDDIFHIFDYIKVLNLEKLDKTQSIISENIIMQKNDFIVLVLPLQDPGFRYLALVPFINKG